MKTKPDSHLDSIWEILTAKEDALLSELETVRKDKEDVLRITTKYKAAAPSIPNGINLYDSSWSNFKKIEFALRLIDKGTTKAITNKICSVEIDLTEEEKEQLRKNIATIFWKDAGRPEEARLFSVEETAEGKVYKLKNNGSIATNL